MYLTQGEGDVKCRRNLSRWWLFAVAYIIVNLAIAPSALAVGIEAIGSPVRLSKCIIVGHRAIGIEKVILVPNDVHLKPTPEVVELVILAWCCRTQGNWTPPKGEPWSFIFSKILHVEFDNDIFGRGMTRVMYQHVDRVRFVAFREAVRSHYTEPSSFVEAKVYSRVMPLEISNARIEDYKNESENFHHETLFISGFLLFFGGIALLFKVWWNLSFNYTSHLNAAGYVALVMTSAVLIWIGMTLTASAFGVFITQG